MGFGSPSKSKPAYTGIQLNTASQVLPVALCYGQNRLAGNLWWYGDFKTTSHSSGKGFGGGKGGSADTYSASVVIGLGEGEWTGVGKAWKDQGEKASYADLRFSFVAGTVPQAPWGYLTANHPTEADSYPGGAYLAQANMDLGSSPTLSNLSFEGYALLWNTGYGGAGGADPAQLIDDYLTNADHGVNAVLAQVLDYTALYSSPAAATTGDTAFQTYCRANGFELSPYLVEQEAAADAIDRWCIGTNTAPVWTGYSLKFVPYGDQVVAGNGVTFLPPTDPAFAFGDRDYQGDGDRDPVIASRADPKDAKNHVWMTVLDRSKAYVQSPVDFQDDNNFWLYGPKEASAVTLKEVTDVALGKRLVALYGQRILYVNNQYRFTVGPSADLLEPMDCGTIDDPKLGVGIPVRLIEIEEQENNDLDMIAEHFSGALGTPALANAAANAANNPNSLVDPGPVNPPIFLEPNSALALRLFGSSTACLAIAVSGGDGTTFDANWGGCVVWVSTDGGTTYAQLGEEIVAPARMGKTTSALALYGGANPDAVHTVGVTLLESNGDLTSVSSADAAAGVTLCYLGGEVLSFKTATLAGANAYTLSGELYRGLYGTTGAAHLAGVDFAALDRNLYRHDLPADYLGVPLKFKFQSFNIYGQALEDLATCVAYAFTPAGTGYGGGAGGAPTTPTGLAATPSGPAQITLSANANPAADNVTSYRWFRAAGTGAAFGTASLIATSATPNHTDTGLPASTGYTYFAEAVNAIGSSAATAGADATTSSTSFGGGAARPIAVAALIAGPGYMYDAAGAAKVVNADATVGDPTSGAYKPANCWISAAALLGANVTVYLPGQYISGLALSPGATYWLDVTAGGVTAVRPSTPGNGDQVIGVVDETGTKLFFAPQPMLGV